MKRSFLVFFCLLALCVSVFAAPWDALRAPADLVGAIEPIINFALVLVAAALLVIAYLAYKKKPSRTLFWVGAAFGLLFVKAALIVIDLYFSPGTFMNYAIQSFFDLLVLGSLFVALFRK